MSVDRTPNAARKERNDLGVFYAGPTVAPHSGGAEESSGNKMRIWAKSEEGGQGGRCRRCPASSKQTDAAIAPLAMPKWAGCFLTTPRPERIDLATFDERSHPGRQLDRRLPAHRGTVTMGRKLPTIARKVGSSTSKRSSWENPTRKKLTSSTATDATTRITRPKTPGNRPRKACRS